MTTKSRCPKCGEDRQIEHLPTKKADRDGESYFCNVCAHQWVTPCDHGVPVPIPEAPPVSECQTPSYDDRQFQAHLVTWLCCRRTVYAVTPGHGCGTCGGQP